MRVFKSLVVVGVMLGAFSAAAVQAAPIDVRNYVNTPQYFTPNEGSTTSSPYYRWYNEDWGWTHGVVDAPTTSATLFVSAWDVDYDGTSSGEFDEIFAWKSGVKTSLGFLAGNNNAWGYTTFSLDSTWWADVHAGLQVFIDIDTTHNYRNWAVALAKSVVTIDGGTPPPPNPTVPDGGATLTLLGGALIVLGALRRKFQA